MKPPLIYRNLIPLVLGSSIRNPIYLPNILFEGKTATGCDAVGHKACHTDIANVFGHFSANDP